MRDAALPKWMAATRVLIVAVAIVSTLDTASAERPVEQTMRRPVAVVFVIAASTDLDVGRAFEVGIVRTVHAGWAFVVPAAVEHAADVRAAIACVASAGSGSRDCSPALPSAARGNATAGSFVEE